MINIDQSTLTDDRTLPTMRSNGSLEETMDYSTLRVAIADGIARITLDRPAKKNAMNPRMQEEMTDLLERLRFDANVRVLVFTGAGDAFCAGMDLQEFFVALKDQPDEYERIDRLSIEWRGRSLRYYPKATIAMVNGYVFGGGLSIVEACDLAIAAEEATFGISEINFKMFPAGTVSKSMANLLRPRDALFYGMTGRPFKGAEAARIGFVNAAVPLARLEEETMALARELAAKDPHALRATKDAYRLSLEMSWEAATSYASARYYEVTARQNAAWRENDVGQFLQGKLKPGLGESRP
jgi:feruloyl-CoA hydratase/lyase